MHVHMQTETEKHRVNRSVSRANSNQWRQSWKEAARAGEVVISHQLLQAE